MAYEKRNDVPVGPGEVAVELDTGSLVAVVCERKPVSGGISYYPAARAINEAGETQCDARGTEVRTGFKQTVDVQKMESMTDAVITRACLLAVLGEPVTEFDWSPELLKDASIRERIKAAAVAGTADAAAVL